VLARRGVSDRVLAKERANEKARAGGELVKENDVSEGAHEREKERR
jgi:hypothetical protein